MRQRILDAARELFISEGYDAVSMRRIAARIEYSPTAIYLHFPDKASILTALCDEMFEKLSRCPRPISPARPTRWRACATDCGSIASSASRTRITTPSRSCSSRSTSRSTQLRASHRAFAFLQAAVAGAMAAGVIRTGDVETTSQALWASCHGVVALLITIPPGRFAFVPPDRLIGHTIDTLIAGLQTSSALPAAPPAATEQAPRKTRPSNSTRSAAAGRSSAATRSSRSTRN